MHWQKIMGYTLIILVALLLIIVVFGPKGWGPSILKNIGALVIDNMPIKNDKEFSEQSSMPAAFGEIYNGFMIARESSEQTCYYPLPKLPENFQEYRFYFEQKQEGILMELTANDKKNKQRTAVNIELVENTRLCAIVDSRLEQFSKNVASYEEYSTAEIKKREGNWIVGSRKEGIYLGGSGYDYDYLYLYKVDASHVCLIPTYEGEACGVESGMLSSKCFEPLKLCKV